MYFLTTKHPQRRPKITSTQIGFSKAKKSCKASFCLKSMYVDSRWVKWVLNTTNRYNRATLVLKALNWLPIIQRSVIKIQSTNQLIGEQQCWQVTWKQSLINYWLHITIWKSDYITYSEAKLMHYISCYLSLVTQPSSVKRCKNLKSFTPTHHKRLYLTCRNIVVYKQVTLQFGRFTEWLVQLQWLHTALEKSQPQTRSYTPSTSTKLGRKFERAKPRETCTEHLTLGKNTLQRT